MATDSIKVHSDIFDEIAQDIKQRNLSRNNMPKLIVGTGLSVVYGVPGMAKLAKYLNKEIAKNPNADLQDMWKKRYTNISTKGLEAGLADLAPGEEVLVGEIRYLTAKYILDREEKLHSKIFEEDTGFSKLLAYLKGTVSVNHKVIDIMTPNYDRIIEIVCDKLKIGVITGFSGNIYGTYHRKLMQRPQDWYNCQQEHCWVRLFKPHGSLNWVSENGKEYLTNDYNVLKNKTKSIEIVAPGSSKYKDGLTNNTFRCMREDFNELLGKGGNYSLLFYGYGFNDDHFDTALFDSFQRNVLILAREVKEEIIKKAMERNNITVFCHIDKKDYMIYKSKQYEIDLPLWNMNRFTEVFLG